MQDCKKRYHGIDLLRLLAVLLVLNSHCDALYPIPALATGGALGNGLFFITAGFLFTGDMERFSNWYARRLRRLYIPSILIILVGMLLFQAWPDTARGWLTALVWPTEFWFVGAMALFYLLCWLLCRKGFLWKRMGVVTLLLGLIYFGIYCFALDTTHWVVEASGGWFKWIYYFYIMLLGIWLRERGPAAGSIRRWVGVALGSVILMYGLKLLMSADGLWMRVQFACQLSVIAFSGAMLLVCLKLEPVAGRLIGRGPFRGLWQGCCWYGGLGLEIYLLQAPAIRACTELPFPGNILLVLAVCLAGAPPLRRLSRGLDGLALGEKEWK